MIVNGELRLSTNQLAYLKKMLEEDAKKNKISIVGKFFQWIDDNILDKTTRLWMYVLEITGVLVIAIVLREFIAGLEMVSAAQTEMELKKAELFLANVRECITPIAMMVSTICAALPTVMGVFRSLKKKWNNGHGGQEQAGNGVT
jgi:CRISPR/Cas system endoribonuclease Cas6 (RAMP superfamily)